MSEISDSDAGDSDRDAGKRGEHWIVQGGRDTSSGGDSGSLSDLNYEYRRPNPEPQNKLQELQHPYTEAAAVRHKRGNHRCQQQCSAAYREASNSLWNDSERLSGKCDAADTLTIAQSVGICANVAKMRLQHSETRRVYYRAMLKYYREMTGKRANLWCTNVVDKVPSKAEREGQDFRSRGGCMQEHPSVSLSEGQAEGRGTKAQPGRLESPYEITTVLGGNRVSCKMSVFNETNELMVLRVVPKEDWLWELASIVKT
ncbi:hypothetical protein OE88DRAFT_1644912 [Heliocybe sulcata]|uniref:Uncharacterized protein n=1 Tax=Heliocybe sulcata TaxID=5364 RepID=A0A5C3N133_9AGAM|nr:hypothetical protein OE88DRAFT_1644912 [Heliocybe sulcata]